MLQTSHQRSTDLKRLIQLLIVLLLLTTTLMIWAGGKQEAAKLLLDFLRSFQARKNELLIENNKVLNLNIRKDAEIRKEQKYADLLLEEMSTWVVWPIEKAAYQDIIKEEMGFALLEEKSVSQALQDAQKRINETFGY